MSAWIERHPPPVASERQGERCKRGRFHHVPVQRHDCLAVLATPVKIGEPEPQAIVVKFFPFHALQDIVTPIPGLSPAFDQISRGFGPGWEMKIKSGAQQSSRHNTPALKNKFSFRPQK
jgi:hypothetical protein